MAGSGDSGVRMRRCQGGTSFQSDIYSLGCVLYEVFSGRIPFYEIKIEFKVMQAITKGKRPARPPQDICRTRGLTDQMWDIVESCWTMLPSSRPTAGDIARSIRFLPNRALDCRHQNGWDEFFPPRLSYFAAENPFSIVPHEGSIYQTSSQALKRGREKEDTSQEALTAKRNRTEVMVVSHISDT